MYLYLGQNVMIPDSALIGIFDMDNTTWSFRTRRFLDRAEQEGRVLTLGEDLPRSYVVSQEPGQPAMVHITQLAPSTLQRRAEEDVFAIAAAAAASAAEPETSPGPAVGPAHQQYHHRQQ